MVVSTPADAGLLRYLFGKAMQPLVADILCWTHSTTAPSSTFLTAPLRSVPSRLSVTSASSTSQSGSRQAAFESCGLARPLPHSNAYLPSFLKPLHDCILVAGYQLRFLSHLPQMRAAVDSLSRSALQQVSLLRAAVVAESGELPEAASALDRSPEHMTSASASHQARWQVGLAWSWRTAAAMETASNSAVDEREALVSAALADLASQRQAADDANAATLLAKLQAREAEALIREQEQQAAHEQERVRKHEMLERQRLAIDERQKGRQVCFLVRLSVRMH